MKVAILSILICLVTLTNCYTYVAFREYNAFSSLIKKWDFNDYYFYSLGMFDSVNVEDIKSLNSVQNLIAINDDNGCGFAFLLKDGKEIDFDSNPQDIFERSFWVHNLSKNQHDVAEIFSIRTVDGRTINRLEPNQILLDEDAQKFYKKGDTILVSFDASYYDGEEYILNIQNIEAEIVGFVSKDMLIIESGRGNGLDYIFRPLDSFPDDTIVSFEMEMGVPASHLITSVFECEGTYYNVEEDYPVLLMIKKNEDASVEDFILDLDSVGIGATKLNYFDDMWQEFQRNHKETVRNSLIFQIVAIVVTLVVIVSSFVEWYTHKNYELIIYNICGCPWKECVLLTAVPNVLALIIGTLIATVVWNFSNSSSRISPWVFALYLVAYMVVYIFILIIYYLLYRNKNTSALYNSKE